MKIPRVYTAKAELEAQIAEAEQALFEAAYVNIGGLRRSLLPRQHNTALLTLMKSIEREIDRRQSGAVYAEPLLVGYDGL